MLLLYLSFVQGFLLPELFPVAIQAPVCSVIYCCQMGFFKFREKSLKPGVGGGSVWFNYK